MLVSLGIGTRVGDPKNDIHQEKTCEIGPRLYGHYCTVNSGLVLSSFVRDL